MVEHIWKVEVSVEEDTDETGLIIFPVLLFPLKWCFKLRADPVFPLPFH